LFIVFTLVLSVSTATTSIVETASYNIQLRTVCRLTTQSYRYFFDFKVVLSSSIGR